MGGGVVSVDCRAFGKVMDIWEAVISKIEGDESGWFEDLGNDGL